ncbi:MAG: TIGR02186 family protein [Sneathiella sp.]|nr:TIGR02186 family protein [Sneathiella sp.]
MTGKRPISVIIFAALFCGLLVPHSSRADNTLVTDISSHLISVTSDFTGTDLLLFGTVTSQGGAAPADKGDIIVVVRGPQKNVTVRKKERVAGIWVNTRAIKIINVPGFYAVASNRPVEDIATIGTLERLKIGSNRLSLRAQNTPLDIQDFRQAILRQQADVKLYTSSPSAVYFLGASLFRTSIHFPANVPVGNYVAEVYLFQDGELVSAQTSPLFIKKFGIGRRIFDFAQNYPTLHGIAAIFFALIAGWIASVIFRKD